MKIKEVRLFLMKFDQKSFNTFIIENNVIGFKEADITLKSGRLCRWYANCRMLTDNVGITNKLSSYIIQFIKSKNLKFDYVFGVPAGVTKLAVAVNIMLGDNTPLIIGREIPKDHGELKDKFFIGPIKENDNIIIVEDVTTTGGSLIDTIEKLKQIKVNIVCAIGIVNRMELRDDGLSVDEKLSKMGVPYFAMSTADTLLPLEYKRNTPSEKTRQHIEQYFEKYSAAKINLKEV